VVSRDTEHLSDSLLLERYAKEKSQEAFSALVSRYADMVYATCFRRLRAAEAAEDASQAVFLLLSQNAGRLNAQRTLAPWLHSMAVLVCKGYLSKEAKLKKIAQEMAKMETNPHKHDETLSLVLVDEALTKLSKEDREAVVLRYLQGLSNEELAQELGTSQDGARMRVNRALAKLRSKLAAFGLVITDADLANKLAHAHLKAPASLVHSLSTPTVLSNLPRALELAKGAKIVMKTTTLKIAGVTAAAIAGTAAMGFIAFNRTQQVFEPFTKVPFHEVTYAVQEAGGNRDPKYPTHFINEQWISPDQARITQYQEASTMEGRKLQTKSDYLLEKRGKEILVTMRNRTKTMTLTKKQAIDGTAEGRWAQEALITPINNDFSKLEHFWKKAVVEIMPATTITVFGAQHQVIPHQVTENGFYRVTGYEDATTSQLLRQEEWSKDEKGWYMEAYEEFDYSPSFTKAFDPENLSTNHPFELAMPANEEKEAKSHP
jgi:RNA polymerase sigma factor (sigma-70 family)